jgi:hypothetical protein
MSEPIEGQTIIAFRHQLALKPRSTVPTLETCLNKANNLQWATHFFRKQSAKLGPGNYRASFFMFIIHILKLILCFYDSLMARDAGKHLKKRRFIKTILIRKWGCIH